MSIASEISRLQTAKAGLKTALEGKGVTVDAAAKIDTYPALVESISAGGGTSSDAELIGIIERSPTSITIPEGCTKIGEYACANMPDLLSVTLPSTITRIENSAFHSCYQLREINLPEGLTYIGQYAFYDAFYKNEVDFLDHWQGFTIIIPSTVTTIEKYAFWDSYWLTTVTFKGTPSSIGTQAFFGMGTNAPNANRVINVPWAEGAVANAPWGVTNATINYNYTGE